MTSSIITDYLGEGVAADRPVTLDIAAGTLGLYFSTDSLALDAWDVGGGAWVSFAGSGSVTAVVAGLGLAGGTITGTGTIDFAAIAGVSILANSGTASAVPVAVGLGSHLAFAGGTLNTTGVVTSVVAGSGLAGGTITAAGTLSLGPTAAGKLVGNSGTAAAVAGPITVGTGLTLSVGGTLSASGGSVTSISTSGLLSGGPITAAGTISMASIAAARLIGNAGTVSAVPAAIPLGSHLAFSGGTLDAIGYGAGTVTSIVAGAGLSGGTITAFGTIAIAALAPSRLFGNPGTASAAPVAVVVGSGLTLDTGGTLSAGGSGSGTVTSVDTGGLLTGGPITGAGTISMAGIAAGTLIGNAGTASDVPAAVPIGSGLVFSGGTLSATGSGGSVTSVVAGAGLSGGTITATGTIALALTTAILGALDLRTLPTSDPGGGLMWINGGGGTSGALWVGPP